MTSNNNSNYEDLGFVDDVVSNHLETQILMDRNKKQLIFGKSRTVILTIL